MSKKQSETAAAAETAQLSEIEKKWGKPLYEAGWTAIPTVIFERQHALGLDAVDINIILHLAGYWWKADTAPYPSKATIAAAMGLHPRTIQKRIAAMEKAGFIQRVPRRSKKGGSQSNKYVLGGLIESAAPYALERTEERKKRASEAKVRAESKKKPALTLVK